MRQHIVLRVVAQLLLPLILLFALYVQFHGDYGPGGGFQAGVIFAAGVILHALVFDLDSTQRALPPWFLRIGISLGVLLYAGVGVLCLLLGGNFLDYNVLAHHPQHGQHLGIFLVELGVGITVASVMITIFYTFARRGRTRRGYLQYDFVQYSTAQRSSSTTTGNIAASDPDVDLDVAPDTDSGRNI